ncbi:MAG: endonuclease III [Candidatus Eremiobacteraeota bacterium]|nr:endonuclease III [Candidatus Eremiobacteraeota bacterium]
MRIPFPAKKVTRITARDELAILENAYPAAVTALLYTNPFELLIAVILSAQNTDARVNMTTPALFKAYPTADKLAAADPSTIEAMIKSCGFFRAKTRSIIGASQAIITYHRGEVPNSREELEALPGVGRKSASVVLSVAFQDAAFAVDTHVFRVAHRLGLTLAKTPREVEMDVTRIVPREKWRHAHHWLILHGRQICKAPLPHCGRCPVQSLCPTPKIILRMKAERIKIATGLMSPGEPASATRRPGRSVSGAKKR